MLDVTNATGPAVPITEQLRRRGVDSRDVKTVIFRYEDPMFVGHCN